MWYPELYFGTKKDSGKTSDPHKVYNLVNSIVLMLIF